MSRPELSPPPPRPRWLDVVGALGVIALGFTVWLGLWVTPPGQVPGATWPGCSNVHPAVATVALYWVGIVAAAGACSTCGPARAGVLVLRPAAVRRRGRCGLLRTDPRDGLALGPAGVGRLVDLGRAVYVDRAVSLLLEIGYLALPAACRPEPAVRARCCAVAALLMRHRHPDRPLLRRLVEYAAPGRDVPGPGFKIHASASMSWTFLLGFVAFSLCLRVAARDALPDRGPGGRGGDEELEVSLAERWSEDEDAPLVGARAPARGPLGGGGAP